MFRTLLVVVPATLAMAADWPQWRGPGRDGGAPALAKAWPKSLTRVWKVDVGTGYSSPVAQGDTIWLFTKQGDLEILQALDWKTGRSLWKQTYAAPFRKNQYAVKMFDGPFSTPVVSNGKVYTFGASAILSCFDARTGTLKWRKDYSRDIDTSKMFTGTAMSPLVDQGRLIIHVGDDRGGAVLALDAESGDERWKWKGDGPGYASPVMVPIGSTRQIVTLTDRSAIGLNAATGELLWSVAFKDEWNENIVTPVFDGRHLILSGVRKGTLAVAVSQEGKTWSAKQVWHSPEIAMYMSSPVLDGDYLYGHSARKKGQFFCLDARSGKTVWTTEGRDAEQASVLKSGTALLLTTTEGELIVASRSPKAFEVLARYKIADSPVWSLPIVAGGEILIKDASSVALWRVTAP